MTKHNIGFLIADQLADMLTIDIDKKKYKAELGEGTIGGEKVIIAKPQTYMNLSGEAVGAIANFYKIPSEDILVIYDDLDLELGRIRFRKKGSAGGHNGIKSLISHLGTEEFCRLKVGIGRPPSGWSTPDYVLSRFSEEEWKTVEDALKLGAEASETWVEAGIDKAMNEFN